MSRSPEPTQIVREHERVQTRAAERGAALAPAARRAPRSRSASWHRRIPDGGRAEGGPRPSSRSASRTCGERADSHPRATRRSQRPGARTRQQAQQRPGRRRARAGHRRRSPAGGRRESSDRCNRPRKEEETSHNVKRTTRGRPAHFPPRRTRRPARSRSCHFSDLGRDYCHLHPLTPAPAIDATDRRLRQ